MSSKIIDRAELCRLYGLGMSVREVADALNANVNTVRWVAHTLRLPFKVGHRDARAVLVAGVLRTLEEGATRG